MSTSILLEEPTGQGWAQVGELVVALLLSSAIGLERHASPRRSSPAWASSAAVGGGQHTVEVVLTPHGRGDADALTEQLVATPGMVTVAYTRADDEYS